MKKPPVDRPAPLLPGPRGAALGALAEQAERFPDLLPMRPETTGLEVRDAALAHTIYDTTIRRWLTLSRVLEAAGGRQISQMEPIVQAALLGGATQLLLLDRVPDHAALDESVQWVKEAGRPRASGMVNAILRKVIAVRGETGGEWDDDQDAIPLPNGSALWMKQDVLQDHPQKRLSSATSVPYEVLRRWVEAFGEVRAREMALHTLVKSPAVVHVGYAGSGVDEEPDLGPHRSDRHRVFTGEDGSLRALLERRRDVWVQDEASSEPIRLVRRHLDREPGLIVDLCAGLGTKTRQLAAEFPNAKILAGDVDEERLRSLRRTFIGHDRVSVMTYPELLDAAKNIGELVLLDVPCSNTGVLPRRSEARYRATTGQMERMMEIQRQIVCAAVGLLSPEGTILYATCSMEPEENEEIAKWADETHGLELVAEHRTWPSGIPGEGPEAYCDGSYGAVLTRRKPRA